MFEFDQHEANRREGSDLVSPTPGPARPDSARREFVELSFMHWGEHCIECADPHCYATCALYRPRPDGRCRRFAYGIYRNRRFSSLRGYGAEVAFERWGKLEAEGNALMEPASAVLRRERMIELSRPALQALGSLAFRLTGNEAWRQWPAHPRKLARRLHRRSSGRRGPDCFVLEVFNPQDRPVTLQFSLRLVPLSSEDRPEALPPPFMSRLVLPAGHSRHRLDRRHFSEILSTGRRFKVTVMPEGDATVRLVFLTLDFVTEPDSVDHGDPALAGAQRVEQPIKCVVFDLDDTLWDGVLVENPEPRPNPEVVKLIQALDRRGVLVSIASKNDHVQAWQRLERIGLADYFIHPQIDWTPKSVGIRRIAEALDIGLDTFAFVDDSPFELTEVKRRLPMVACVGVEVVGNLLDHPRLVGSHSPDGSRRREYYRQAIIRERQQASWRDDYLGFLRTSEIKLTVRRYRETDLARVTELVQRTNQLNFSGTRYAPAELADRLNDEHVEKYVLDCRDRFGSYGTVGFAFVARSAAAVRVEDLMISCRVQGRAIEHAFFGFLIRRTDEPKPDRIWVCFRPRERNRPALHVLENLGFVQDDTGEGLVVETARLADDSDVVEVIEPEELPAPPERQADPLV